MKETKFLKSNGEEINDKLDRIVIALERIANVLESNRIVDEREFGEEEGISGIDFEKPVAEAPSEIKFATSEELAAELVNFTKKEFPDDERDWKRNIFLLFWGQKNISKENMPPKIQLKIEKAEMLAQKHFNAEEEVKTKEQLEKEKIKLPSLISSCVDWAKDHGLRKVTQADVDVFLFEKNIELLSQTKRLLYAMANIAIKSKP